MKNKHRLSAIICAKAEPKTLPKVVRSVARYVDEIVVVLAPNDQLDGVSQETSKCKLRVLHDTGKGKGEALRLGASVATGSIFVFMDADGSHKPYDIPKLVQPICDVQADMVVASRGRGGSDELHGTVEKMIRLIGSSIITTIINIRFKVELTDSQNGFRAVSSSAWKKLALHTNTFAIEQEMLMQALKRGLRVAEIPSHESARMYGSSKINLWVSSHHFLWVLLRNL